MVDFASASESSDMPALVLASVSPYRRQLLERLQLPFVTEAPLTDETPLPGEPPQARALRLAEEKSLALAARYPNALLLGGDQTIAGDDGELFDKPGTAERAVTQLCRMRGRALTFYTAVALTNTTNTAANTANTKNAAAGAVAGAAAGAAAAEAGGVKPPVQARLVTHRARFRHASEEEIRRYVQKENATNCAGGAQIEGLGIALLQEINGGDPTALVGLPLMVVAALLRENGVAVP